MISRIIIRQSQRRDQILWSYGLRNEFPSNNDYTNGLISIILHGNKLGEKSTDKICYSLSSDQYIRYIDLSDNLIDNNSCKKYIYMMRKNNTLLTVDLRNNPGYDENVHSRLVMKMSKNIHFLYQQYQNGAYTDEEFEARRQLYSHAQPFTKESLLYREIFERYYPGQSKMIVDFWMPNKSWKGCDVNDPSARVLSNYGASAV